MAIEATDQVCTVRTKHGDVRVRDTGGEGPPVLLVHSLLADPDAYALLVPHLVDQGRRCLIPELPLGAHLMPMNREADPTPPGLARLLVEVLDAVGIASADVVGVDTGGALTQLLMAHHRERVGAVVLTACDAYDQFPPTRFRAAVRFACLPGVLAVAGQLARASRVRRGFAPRPLTHVGLDDATLRRWTAPLRSSGVRRDVRRAISGMRAVHTLTAAEANRDFPRLVTIAWGDDDFFFPSRLADRLAADIPKSRQVTLTDCAALAALDQPLKLAEIIAETFGPVTGHPTRMADFAGHEHQER